MDAQSAERWNNLSLALALSAGLHLIALMTLELSPGAWRHGFRPALKVVLKGIPREAAPSEYFTDLPLVSSTPEPAAPAGGQSRQAEALRSAPDSDGHVVPVAAPGSSLPITDRYYKRSEVNVVAVPIERGPLIFPVDPYIWRLAGKVQARVFINETGVVDSVQIVEARPPGHFEHAAVEALRQVRYQPAEIAGVPVKSQKLIEVSFDPYEPRPFEPTP